LRNRRRQVPKQEGREREREELDLILHKEVHENVSSLTVADLKI
jgi:hypothetical protein